MFASLHTASLATRRVQVRARPAHSVADSVAASLLRLAGQALAARTQRKALAALDDRALHDIGVTRIAALTEAEKPLWDVPGHWFR